MDLPERRRHAPNEQPGRAVSPPGRDLAQEELRHGLGAGEPIRRADPLGITTLQLQQRDVVAFLLHARQAAVAHDAPLSVTPGT